MCDRDLPTASLGDLVSLVNDKAVTKKDPSRPYIGLEHLASGQPHLMGSAPSNTSVSTNGVFAQGDILFGKLRPNLRKSVVAPVGGYCSTDILILRATERAAGRFAAKHFQSEPVFAEAVKSAVGTKMPRTSWGALRNFEVFTPPLPEQRRIAEILDTLDDLILKTEQIIAKLKQVKQGMLHDLLTRGIDENGELRDPERHPEQFKDSPLGRIPKEWEIERLIDRISLPSGQLDPKREPYASWVLVAPDHVEASSGRLLTTETARAQGAISGKYGISPGDIVYSKIRPYLRKAILATFQGLCSADMYPMRPGPAMDSRFLLALILGEHFSHFAEAVSMRSGFPKINREELSEYRAALPPLPEQQRIASILDSHNERQRGEHAGLEKLKLIKSGLMEDLLTGRVRVTDLGDAA